MYKCKNKDCEFILTDTVVSYNNNMKTEGIIKRMKCPDCNQDLEYINELLQKYDKYKKHMR